MVQERPRRRGRKRGRGRPKKAPAKRPQAQQPPVPEEEQLPGLLEDEIPEQPTAAEQAVVEEEQPAVVKEAAISAEAAEAVVPAPRRQPARRPARPAALPVTLMNIPEFRQQVVRLVVRKLG